MSTVSIHAEHKNNNQQMYRAIAGNRQDVGATRGEALDTLIAERDPNEPETVILIERFEPDVFFTEKQQQRKRALMGKHPVLTPEERMELESLLDAELDATIARTRPPFTRL